MSMNFDNIAETQIFEGNTLDHIFAKKRGPRKRKSQTLQRDSSLILQAPLYQSTPEEESPELNKTDPDQFAFTNENLIRRDHTTSVLFQQYFPPEVLQFTEDELEEINQLHRKLVDQQTQADRMLLSEANVNQLEKSCLIEKFLQEQRHGSFQGIQSQSPSFLLDSNGSPVINLSSEEQNKTD